MYFLGAVVVRFSPGEMRVIAFGSSHVIIVGRSMNLSECFLHSRKHVLVIVKWKRTLENNRIKENKRDFTAWVFVSTLSLIYICMCMMARKFLFASFSGQFCLFFFLFIYSCTYYSFQLSLSFFWFHCPSLSEKF